MSWVHGTHIETSSSMPPSAYSPLGPARHSIFFLPQVWFRTSNIYEDTKSTFGTHDLTYVILSLVLLTFQLYYRDETLNFTSTLIF